MRRLLIVFLAMSPFVVLLALMSANSQGMAQQPTPTDAEAMAAVIEASTFLESELEAQCAPEVAAQDGNINQFPSNRTSDLRIDIGAEKEKDFAAVVNGGNGAGFASSQNQAPGRQGILDSLSKLNKEDVWIFSGHSATDALGAVIGLRGRRAENQLDVILTARIDAALRADRDPPGIAFLGGCQTAVLLPTFVNAGTQVAIGWDKDISRGPGQAALREFWSKIFANKTFGEARQAAHAAYEARERELKREGEAGIAEADRLLQGGTLDEEDRMLMEEAKRTIRRSIEQTDRELANLPQLVISGKAAVGDPKGKKLADVITVRAAEPTPPSAVGGNFFVPGTDGTLPEQSASSGSHTAAIAGILVGGAAIVAVTLGVSWASRRSLGR